MLFPFSDNVILHSSEEFFKHEIIKPTLQHGRHKRDIVDTRLEVGFLLFSILIKKNDNLLQKAVKLVIIGFWFVNKLNFIFVLHFTPFYFITL